MCQGSKFNKKRIVLEQAILILKMQLFCNLVFLLKQKLTILYLKVLVTLNKLLLLGISFLRIIYKVVTFPNIQKCFLPFSSETMPKILSNIHQGVRY